MKTTIMKTNIVCTVQYTHTLIHLPPKHSRVCFILERMQRTPSRKTGKAFFIFCVFFCCCCTHTYRDRQKKIETETGDVSECIGWYLLSHSKIFFMILFLFCRSPFKVFTDVCTIVLLFDVCLACVCVF